MRLLTSSTNSLVVKLPTVPSLHLSRYSLCVFDSGLATSWLLSRKPFVHLPTCFMPSPFYFPLCATQRVLRLESVVWSLASWQIKIRLFELEPSPGFLASTQGSKWIWMDGWMYKWVITNMWGPSVQAACTSVHESCSREECGGQDSPAVRSDHTLWPWPLGILWSWPLKDLLAFSQVINGHQLPTKYSLHPCLIWEWSLEPFCPNELCKDC